MSKKTSNVNYLDSITLQVTRTVFPHRYPAIRQNVETHLSVCLPAPTLLLIWVVLAGGCVSTSASFDEFAEQNFIDSRVVPGDRFQHVVYSKDRPRIGTASLHVYIGGDGTPWQDNEPTTDPTPRNPLALRLMLVDPAPAIYLGRPCFHGLAESDQCTAREWTSARYSVAAIESMATVIESYMAKRVVLVGYSGGGALAALLAARLNNVESLITVAANLDIAAWADAHGYESLVDSVNPAEQPELHRSIEQVHLVGGRDLVVPKYSGQEFFNKNPSARIIEYPAFNHVCCWENEWLDILTRVNLTPTTVD